jgi:hypothetical protein
MNFGVFNIKSSKSKEIIDWLNSKNQHVFVDYMIVKHDDTVDYWFMDGQTAMHFKLIFCE